ncbi:MAG: AAA family ATPase [Minisyncoccia bacterium]
MPFFTIGMYLKSIEITGFKSFAKKSFFDFDSPISAIVGPNGSGKSNVAEAFRFVLGEQSMKSMRGKRGEDLIFNGSQDTPKSSRATVKLTFDNSKRVFPTVDFSEVVLERTVSRDGVNEYSLNGGKVRLKDILELLSSAHIGASGHHIISQGEADRILSANTKERRDMIEDALGLKAYQYKKEESEKKLEKTRENMREVEGLRREITPHLKFLRKQMEKVARTEELRNTLSQASAEFFGVESNFLKQELKKISEEIVPVRNELSQIAKNIHEARSKLEESSKVHELSKDLQNAEIEKEKIRQKINNVLRELGRLEGETSALKRVTEKVHTAISYDTAEAFLDKLTLLVSKLKEVAIKGDIAQVQSYVESLNKEISDFKNINQSSVSDEKNDLLKLLSEKEKLSNELISLKKQDEEVINKYSLLAKQVEDEKEGSRTAEKAVYELLSKEKDVRGRELILIQQERELGMRSDELKRNMAEVGALVGRAFLEEMAKEATFKNFSQEEFETKRKEIERLKVRFEEAGIGGTADIEKEFKEVSERDVFLEKELEDLNTSAQSLENLIVELSEKLENDFEVGLIKINKAFEEFFVILFGGGKASLQVKNIKKRQQQIEDTEGVEELDAQNEEREESGIDINVSLPRKKTSGLMMLSGGERALTSIALIFAMSQVNPPPFIILDETDAALDEANSRRYGEMVENLAAKSQLIVITHNRETMSHAGIIYGVTMGGSGISKVLSISFADAEAVAK